MFKKKSGLLILLMEIYADCLAWDATNDKSAGHRDTS